MIPNKLCKVHEKVLKAKLLNAVCSKSLSKKNILSGHSTLSASEENFKL